MFAAKGTGSSSTNCFDKSWRQYVVKALGFSVTGVRTTRWTTWKADRKEGRKESARRPARRGDESASKRRGLSKFRLNSPRINIRNGAPGCHKLACYSLLSFPDSTICTAVRLSFTSLPHQHVICRYNESLATWFKKFPARRKRHRLDYA